MEALDFINEATRRNIINELSKSLDGLGINAEKIILDINAKAVSLKICLCNE